MHSIQHVGSQQFVALEGTSDVSQPEGARAQSASNQPSYNADWAVVNYRHASLSSRNMQWALVTDCLMWVLAITLLHGVYETWCSLVSGHQNSSCRIPWPLWMYSQEHKRVHLTMQMVACVMCKRGSPSLLFWRVRWVWVSGRAVVAPVQQGREAGHVVYSIAQKM